MKPAQALAIAVLLLTPSLALAQDAGRRGDLTVSSQGAQTATPGRAQAERALRALRAVLATTQKEPRKGGRMHFAYQLEAKPGCRVQLTSSWKSARAERRTVYQADLAGLSPEIAVQRSSGESPVIVSVHTWSGRPEVVQRVVAGGAAAEEQTDKVTFLLWDHGLADTLAHRLAGAVRACGGRS